MDSDLRFVIRGIDLTPLVTSGKIICGEEFIDGFTRLPEALLIRWHPWQQETDYPCGLNSTLGAGMLRGPEAIAPTLATAAFEWRLSSRERGFDEGL